LKRERRKYDRYVAPNNAFAALGPNITTVGRVREISLGGVRLEYISDRSTIADSREVEIFIAGNGFLLPGIPCRLIYDVPLSTIGQAYDLPFITKKCGLAFDNLSKDQHSQLKYFLETHTLGLSP
jgi:hypothetical protein